MRILFPAIVLLCVGCASSPTPVSPSDPVQAPASVISSPSVSPPASSPTPVGSLPKAIESALFQAIGKQFQVSTDVLTVKQARPQTWPDTCLGLGRMDEGCGQMLVDGWSVEVTDGTQTWTYRTDATGQGLRLESP